MALIAGYVSARPMAIESIDDRMSAAGLRTKHDDDHHTVVSIPFGHIIATHRHRHPVPPRVTSDARGNVLARLGFVWPDGAELLSTAVNSGARSLEQAEGEFVTVFAEAASRTVHIVNGRFAARPFYVLRGSDRTYFSSNAAFLLALANEPYRPDIPGWMQVLALGHTVGRRTTIARVHRLQPATHMVVSPEDVSERTYWRLRHEPDASLDATRHASDVFEAFRNGAERRARLVGKGVIALSGGLDSRLVAGALPRDSNFTAFTFVDVVGEKETEQTRAAAAVCQALNLVHRVEVLPTAFARPAEVIALTGGMRPYQHMAIAMAYVREVQRHGGKFLLGGGPGDVLAGSYIPSTAYVDPRRNEDCMTDACRQRLAGSRDWRQIFNADAVRGCGPAATEDVVKSFAATSGPTAAHRVTAWAMTCRQPAFTFTSVFHTHSDVSEAVCHLDYRYTDLMLQLPAAWLYQKSFYAYMIHRCLPELRSVPYANTGKPLSGEVPSLKLPQERRLPEPLRHTYQLARRTAGRLVRTVYGEQTSTRPFVFADAALLQEIRERMHSINALREIVDIKRCDQLLARTRDGLNISYEVLGTLTSLCFSFDLGATDRLRKAAV